MYSGDSNAKLGVAVQLVKTGDVAMPEDWDGGYNYVGSVGSDGRTYMPFPIGSTLVYIPCVLAGELLSRVSPALPVRYVTEFLVAGTNAFFSAALCVILFLAAAVLGYSKRTALLTSLVAGLATIVWPYAKQDWSETPAALAVAITAYWLVCYRLKPRRRYAVGAGLALGAASLFRLETMALFPVGIGLLAYAWYKTDRFHPFHQMLMGFSLAYLIAWAPNAWYNHVRSGNPLNFVYGEFEQSKELAHRASDTASPGFSSQGGRETLSKEEGIPPSNKGNPWVQRALSIPKRLPLTIAKILVSPGKSVLFFSPPLLLLPWAWPRFRRQQAGNFWLWMGLPVAYIAILCLYGAGATWSWGERYWMPIVPMLILPLAAFGEERSGPISAPARLSSAFIVLVLAGFSVQCLGVATNYQVTYEKYLIYSGNLVWGMDSPMFWYPPNSLLWLSLKELRSLAQGTLEVANQRWSGKNLLDPSIVPATKLSGVIHKPTDRIRFNTFDFWWLYAYFAGFPGLFVAFGLALFGGTACFAGWQLLR